MPQGMREELLWSTGVSLLVGAMPGASAFVLFAV